MRFLSFVFILILTFSSCQPKFEDDFTSGMDLCAFTNAKETPQYASVLNTDQELSYKTIWEAQFKLINGLDQQEFEKFIKDVKVSSYEWEGGISFQVDYIIEYYWLRIINTDYYLVKLNSDWNEYGNQSIPRDVFLEEEWVLYNIENEIYHPKISEINFEEEMSYRSCSEALLDFADRTGYIDFIADIATYYVPYKDIPMDGDPYFIGKLVIDDEGNLCEIGYLNLITGRIFHWEDDCEIN